MKFASKILTSASYSLGKTRYFTYLTVTTTNFNWYFFFRRRRPFTSLFFWIGFTMRRKRQSCIFDLIFTSVHIEAWFLRKPSTFTSERTRIFAVYDATKFELAIPYLILYLIRHLIWLSIFFSLSLAVWWVTIRQYINRIHQCKLSSFSSIMSSTILITFIAFAVVANVFTASITVVSTTSWCNWIAVFEWCCSSDTTRIQRIGHIGAKWWVTNCFPQQKPVSGLIFFQ